MLPTSIRLALFGSWLGLPALGAPPQTLERVAHEETTVHEAPSEEVLSEVRALAQDRWTKVHTQQTEDAIWARGKTYKASFGRDGTTYFPLLGPDKPRLFGFGLRSPSFTMGGESIALAPGATPRGSETEVRYDHGPVTEWYRLKPNSIEQLFTFNAPLGDGRLTVTIPVQTELQPVPFKGGFLFQNEFGGVHYGAATVLDAARHEESAETRWIDGSLQIEVSETFLASAQWPVTIDPLIATFAVDTWVDDLNKPDIAYDFTNDRILITYEESASGADHDIYWSIINLSDLTVAVGDYFDSTADDWYRPRVANNNFSDSFLIVAEQDFGSFKNVGYRIVDAATGTQSGVQGVSAIEFVSNDMPDVGGEVVDADPSFWLIAWIEDDFNGHRRVVTTRVDQSGQCTFDNLRLYSSPAPANEPAVCNSAGAGGDFNVVYEVGATGNRRVRGASVRWTGALTHPDHPIASVFGDLARPRVSGNLDSAGGKYMVVFEDIQGPGVTNVWATVCLGGSPLFSQNLTDQGGVNLSAFRGQVNVDHDGERFGVVWSENVGGGNYDVLASTFVLAGDNLCESESRVALQGGNLDDERSPTICSLFGAGGPSGSTYAAWSLEESSANVYAAHYGLNPTNCVGNAYCNPAVANSTGQLGRILAIGSHVAGGNPLRLSADQVPTNQFGFFICATAADSTIPAGSQGRLCLGGVLGRYSRNASEIMSSGATGSFSLDIDTLAMPTSPAQPVLAGQNWQFQAWHRDVNPVQTSNFTRATQIRFD